MTTAINFVLAAIANLDPESSFLQGVGFKDEVSASAGLDGVQGKFQKGINFKHLGGDGSKQGENRGIGLDGNLVER